MKEFGQLIYLNVERGAWEIARVGRFWNGSYNQSLRGHRWIHETSSILQLFIKSFDASTKISKRCTLASCSSPLKIIILIIESRILGYPWLKYAFFLPRCLFWRRGAIIKVLLKQYVLIIDMFQTGSLKKLTDRSQECQSAPQTRENVIRFGSSQKNPGSTTMSPQMYLQHDIHVWIPKSTNSIFAFKQPCPLNVHKVAKLFQTVQFSPAIEYIPKKGPRHHLSWRLDDKDMTSK